MIFDTHAHYEDKAFDLDRDDLLLHFPEQGIGRVVNIGSSLDSCRKTIELMERYPYIYGGLGVHPGESGELEEDSTDSIDWLKKQCEMSKCVAIGEIGLDYYWEEPHPNVQKKWFHRQLQLAKEVNLPVVIHSRDAAKDTLDILKAENARDVGGVMHCYAYSKEIAKTVLDMGFYFGVGGVLTFKNGRKLKETVEYLPMEAIVLETDCPYLAPVPYRGKRNTSLYLPYVIHAIAEIKGMCEKEVEQITWENACRLYCISE